MWGNELTVVVVDDDQGCRELHSQWLSDHDVVTVGDGETALETIDERVDLVVLDREIPGTNGDEVARRLDERGFEGVVVMVTGVSPDFDVLELPVDDYLVKPVSERELSSAVERLASQAACQAHLREAFSLAARKARLEVEKSRRELARNDEYQRVAEKLGERRARMTERLADTTGAGDWTAAFRACNTPSVEPASTD